MANNTTTKKKTAVKRKTGRPASKAKVDKITPEMFEDDDDDIIDDEEEMIEDEIKEEVAPVATSASARKTRPKHASDELIPCRSVFRGEVNYPAQKSGILYIWNGYGDEVDVEYQDLLPLVITKSAYLYMPWIIITDDEILDEWPDLRKFYEKIYKLEDLDAVLELDADEFRNALLVMPEGLRNSLKVAIATGIEDGTFDSLQKIKIVDQILGTDLACLLNE